MSASEVCKRLFPLIEQVNDPPEPGETVSKADTTYLVSADEGRSLKTAISRGPRPTPSPCRAASTPKPAAPKSRN